jgi:hypothetical protein
MPGALPQARLVIALLMGAMMRGSGAIVKARSND